MKSFVQKLSSVLPPKQAGTDKLRPIACGALASFSRLMPEVDAVVESDDDIRTSLKVARAGPGMLGFVGKESNLVRCTIKHRLLPCIVVWIITPLQAPMLRWMSPCSAKPRCHHSRVGSLKTVY